MRQSARCAQTLRTVYDLPATKTWRQRFGFYGSKADHGYTGSARIRGVKLGSGFLLQGCCLRHACGWFLEGFRLYHLNIRCKHLPTPTERSFKSFERGQSLARTFCSHTDCKIYEPQAPNPKPQTLQPNPDPYIIPKAQNLNLNPLKAPCMKPQAGGSLCELLCRRERSHRRFHAAVVLAGAVWLDGRRVGELWGSGFGGLKFFLNP